MTMVVVVMEHYAEGAARGRALSSVSCLHRSRGEGDLARGFSRACSGDALNTRRHYVGGCGDDDGHHVSTRRLAK